MVGDGHGVPAPARTEPPLVGAVRLDVDRPLRMASSEVRLDAVVHGALPVLPPSLKGVAAGHIGSCGWRGAVGVFVAEDREGL
jgi:hypothetical protein